MENSNVNLLPPVLSTKLDTLSPVRVAPRLEESETLRLGYIVRRSAPKVDPQHLAASHLWNLSSVIDYSIDAAHQHFSPGQVIGMGKKTVTQREINLLVPRVESEVRSPDSHRVRKKALNHREFPLFQEKISPMFVRPQDDDNVVYMTSLFNSNYEQRLESLVKKRSKLQKSRSLRFKRNLRDSFDYFDFGLPELFYEKQQTKPFTYEKVDNLFYPFSKGCKEETEFLNMTNISKNQTFLPHESEALQTPEIPIYSRTRHNGELKVLWADNSRSIFNSKPHVFPAPYEKFIEFHTNYGVPFPREYQSDDLPMADYPYIESAPFDVSEFEFTFGELLTHDFTILNEKIIGDNHAFLVHDYHHIDCNTSMLLDFIHENNEVCLTEDYHNLEKLKSMTFAEVVSKKKQQRKKKIQVVSSEVSSNDTACSSTHYEQTVTSVPVSNDVVPEIQEKSKREKLISHLAPGAWLTCGKTKIRVWNEVVPYMFNSFKENSPYLDEPAPYIRGEDHFNLLINTKTLSEKYKKVIKYSKLGKQFNWSEADFKFLI